MAMNLLRSDSIIRNIRPKDAMFLIFLSDAIIRGESAGIVAENRWLRPVMARSNRNGPFWRTTFALFLFLRISLLVSLPIPKHRPISSLRVVPPEACSRIGRIIDAITSGTGSSQECRRLGDSDRLSFIQSSSRLTASSVGIASCQCRMFRRPLLRKLSIGNNECSA